MHTLGPRQIEVAGPAGEDLLAVGCFGRWGDWIGEVLCLPTQSVVERKVSCDLPSILNEYGKLVVRDRGKAGLIFRLACLRWSVLDVKEERTAVICRATGRGVECSIRAFNRGRPETCPHRCGRGVMQKPRHVTEDISAVQEPAEDLCGYALYPSSA